MSANASNPRVTFAHLQYCLRERLWRHAQSLAHDMHAALGSQDIIGLSPGTGQFTIGLYADRLRTVTCLSDTYLTVWLTGQLDRPMCFFADSLVKICDVLDTYQTVTRQFGCGKNVTGQFTFWVQFGYV